MELCTLFAMVSTGQYLPNQHPQEGNPHFWLEGQEYAKPHGSPWSKEDARVVLGSQGIKTPRWGYLGALE